MISRTVARASALLGLAVLPLASAVPSHAQESPAASYAQAPDSFRVTFKTSHGSFVVQVNRDWAPKGADRFYTLVRQHFFDDSRFFRSIPRFVAQFGLAGDPHANDAWDAQPITDDPVTHSNLRGTLTFATEGPNTRTHQLFFNLVDNARLDKLGFAPIGRVIQGMGIVESIYTGYGDTPEQDFIQKLGNPYLDREYPKLDHIVSVELTPIK